MKKRNRLLVAGIIFLSLLVIMMMYGRIAIWAVRLAPIKRVAFGMRLNKNHINQSDLPSNFSYRGKEDALSYYSARDQYFGVEVVSRHEEHVLSDFLFDRRGTCLLWRGRVHLIGANHAHGLYDFTRDGGLEKVIAYQVKPAKESYDSFLEIWRLRGHCAKLLLKVAYDAMYSVEADHYEFTRVSVQHNESGDLAIALLGPDLEELVVFLWSSEERRFVASSQEGKLWRLHIPSTAGDEEL